MPKSHFGPWFFAQAKQVATATYAASYHMHGSVPCDPSPVVADGSGVWDASRLLPAATSLLGTLSNPLNVTLLASHLLSAPAIWPVPSDVSTYKTVFSVFYTATLQAIGKRDGQFVNSNRTALSSDDWLTAVVKGADESSPRWRHLLLLGGLLHGMSKDEEQGSSRLRSKIELALVTATNLSLNPDDGQDPIRNLCVAFVINHTFPLLADHLRASLDYDKLLPVLMESAFFSVEGLDHGYWLGMIDQDIEYTSSRRLQWSPKSRTFANLKQIQTRSFVLSLGPLARLIAHAVEHARDPTLISATIDRLVEFSRNLLISWRQNKLSGIEISQETDALDVQTLKVSLPVLWQVLRMALLAVVAILRSALGRLLHDALLAGPNAPLVAIQSLHILRNLYFVSSRLGQTTSSQYRFINFTSIDILNQYPEQTESFLRATQPATLGQIADHALDRVLDLFWLNTAEHFTLVLSPAVNDALLIPAAIPYLTSTGDKSMMEVFEAGHSLMLSVVAVPKNAHVCVKHLPFYIEALLSAFPTNLSPRQFRVAFKSIVQIAAPPSPVTDTQPLMQSILLELIYSRTATAAVLPIPETSTITQGPALSEQAVLVMTIIDSLCYLPVPVLEDWIPLTADLLPKVQDPAMRQACEERFWEALSSGEMDVERAATAVAWWTTRGGREMVLYGDDLPDDDLALMSGALPAHESKL